MSFSGKGVNASVFVNFRDGQVLGYSGRVAVVEVDGYIRGTTIYAHSPGYLDGHVSDAAWQNAMNQNPEAVLLVLKGTMALGPDLEDIPVVAGSAMGFITQTDGKNRRLRQEAKDVRSVYVNPLKPLSPRLRASANQAGGLLIELNK